MTPTLEECANELWILTHPDLRHSVRVGTVFEALRQELGAAAPLLAGQRPVRE